MDEIKEILKDMLNKNRGEKLISAESHPGGVNSLIYKLSTDSGKEYLAKQYLVRKGDKRDHLSTEYFGLSFLWNNGIKNIPEPICFNKGCQIGIYSYVKGRKMQSHEITSGDVHMAADFLERMHSLVNIEQVDEQPVASEACFSISAYIECVEARLGRLRSIKKSDDLSKQLSNYLDNEFIPFFAKIKQYINDQAKKHKIDINRQLKRREKTLSPSDFGFHNCLKKEDGSLVFIDFEYYGWDDPAKMISDFYLQPAIPVPFKQRTLFFDKVYHYLGSDASLRKRLPLIYILLALKWCLIMLNVFCYAENDKVICLQQLEKAKIKLNEIKREFSSGVFPICKEGINE